MATQPVAKLTAQEYLALERASETKHEFLDGEMFAMSGVSIAHARLSMRLSFEVLEVLRGSKCEPFGSELRVRASNNSYFYPDLTIVCGPPELADEQHDAICNPRVIFEILSPSTEKFDRGLKFQHYRTIPSLTDYVLIDQTQVRIEHFSRQADGTWSLGDLEGLHAVLDLSVGVSIPLNRIYTVGNIDN